MLDRGGFTSEGMEPLLQVEDLRIHFNTYKGTVRALDPAVVAVADHPYAVACGIDSVTPFDALNRSSSVSVL